MNLNCTEIIVPYVRVFFIFFFFLSFLSFSVCFFLFLHYFCVCISVLLCYSNTSFKKKKKSIPQILICFDLNPSPSFFSSATLEKLVLSTCRSSLCDSCHPCPLNGEAGGTKSPGHLWLPSAFSQAQLEVQ